MRSPGLFAWQLPQPFWKAVSCSGMLEGYCLSGGWTHLWSLPTQNVLIIPWWVIYILSLPIDHSTRQLSKTGPGVQVDNNKIRAGGSCCCYITTCCFQKMQGGVTPVSSKLILRLRSVQFKNWRTMEWIRNGSSWFKEMKGSSSLDDIENGNPQSHLYLILACIT